MKILVDMNLSPKLAGLLMNHGIETIHWYMVGRSDSKDLEIMEYAKEHNYIVLSCDLDFSAILAATHGQKPSVVQLRTQNFQLEDTAKLLVNALYQNSKDLQNGAILTIDVRKARLCLLPI